MDSKAEDSYMVCTVSTRDAESGLEDGNFFSPFHKNSSSLETGNLGGPLESATTILLILRSHHTLLYLKFPSPKSEGLVMARGPGDRLWSLDTLCHMERSVYVILHLYIFL